MKNKWGIITTVGVVAIVIACLVGGKIITDNVEAARIEEIKAQMSVPPINTSAADTALEPLAKATPIPISSLPPITLPTPAPVVGTETITEDEDGNITIKPDWSSKPVGVAPDAKPSANIGGSGGGKLDLDENGIYRGDHPDETPPPAKTPTPTPKPTPEPTPAPAQSTDDPQTKPEQTEAPVTTPPPQKPTGDDATPKNGQISEDGSQMWISGFGWCPNVGPGSSSPGKGEFTEAGGEIVGSM